MVCVFCILKNVIKVVLGNKDGQHNPMNCAALVQRGCANAARLTLTWGAFQHPCIATKTTGLALQAAPVLLCPCSTSLTSAEAGRRKGGAMTGQLRDWQEQYGTWAGPGFDHTATS